jgi:hypothetical protein
MKLVLVAGYSLLVEDPVFSGIADSFHALA